MLMGQTGEHHDQSPRPLNLLIELLITTPPQCMHTPLNLNQLLPQKDNYNLCYTTSLDKKKQQKTADFKSTYQNSSAPPHKNLLPCLNILSLATCNLRPVFVGAQSPELTFVPSREGGGGEPTVKCSTFTFML